MAGPYYQGALDWWSGVPDLDMARERYLAMVWKMARPAWHRQHWGNRLNHQHVPQQVLENADDRVLVAVRRGKSSLYVVLKR